MRIAKISIPFSPKIALGALLALTTAACGHENKLYRDPARPMVIPAISHTQASRLPLDFFDQSVNLAAAEVALDGVTTTSIAILLETNTSTNPPGGFNGSGTGNRAVLGLAINSPKKLSSLSGGVTFDAKSVNGAEKVGVSIVVDLDCTGTGASTRILNATPTNLAPGSAQADGYTRFSAGFDEARWLVSGSDITDPGNPATILVPASGSSVTLTDLISKFPDACVHNATNTDDALAKGLASAGVLLTVGEPTTVTLNKVFINRVTIGSTVHSNTAWGNP
jgi:hypothetical protein